ncbi:unnamed protein product [Dibothriocephalus latus]|uniref:RRM domain-containing protein n=1 Tax=Dibothriocephalus latus TaxID=60516 RepID=A0A3P7KZT6_DIBLA|nr:unnamed protein product [Dibothriocephalus latus]
MHYPIYAYSTLPEVAEFLKQHNGEEQIIVRMRGLPFTAKKQDIIDFFCGVQADILGGSDGIFFVNYGGKRPTGDAFVIFPSGEIADRGLALHKCYLGQRYVELFKASPSELVQVLLVLL